MKFCSVFLISIYFECLPLLVCSLREHGWSPFRERYPNNNFARRPGSIRQWIQDSFRHPFFGHVPSLTKETNEPEFDPSVVILDKGAEETPMTADSFPLPTFDMTFDSHRPFWSFGEAFPSSRPWWKGPNVCIERRVIEGKVVDNSTRNSGLLIDGKNRSFKTFSTFFSTNSHSFDQSFSLESTHCTESDTSYTCVSKLIRGQENKTTIVKHQCCHGFKRIFNEFCTQVELKDLVQTLKELKSNRMMKMIERMGLSQELLDQNITVFSVTDESLVEYEDDHNKNENEIETEGQVIPSSVRKRRESESGLKNIISMHLVPGFFKTGDFEDEQLIGTLSESNKSIRINIFQNPKRVVTANCAPIISANNYASNGIVHIIDRVMSVPTKTLAEIIETEERFSILKNLLDKTDLSIRLRDGKQHLTLFAPTDEAFKKLGEGYLGRLLNGQSCVEPLLQNHIINSTLCSTAIQDIGSVINSLKSSLIIQRIGDKLEVGGKHMIQTDLLATNGVIHVIDGVLISERSQPISQFLKNHRMIEYQQLINESGLTNDWDALQNVSFIIPTSDSMKALPQTRIEYLRNNSKEILEFNAIKPKTNVFEWNSNQMLDTMSGNQIRVNSFGDLLGLGFKPIKTVQCVKVLAEREICGATVQIVNKIITPAKGNLIEMLKSMGSFTKLIEIIKKSELSDQLSKGAYTLLAMTDQTLGHQLSPNQIDFLVNNQSESEKFIRKHLFPEIVCCSGVNGSPLFLTSEQIRNSEGTLISTHKSFNGRIRFGNSRVNECDIMATNGVIHVVNSILEDEPQFINTLPFPSFHFSFK